MRNIKGLIIPFFFIIVSACKTTQTNQQLSSTQPLFTIDSIQVYPDEFLYAYEKSNRNKGAQEPIEDYLDLYIDFKLKVLAAKHNGLDTSASYQKELEGYLKEIKKPYLTTEKVNKKLVEEAYDRLQMEINASHILITLEKDALPADTLKAYQKILAIKKEYEGGKSFESLARKYSQDPSAQSNNGQLGWFTAFQMVYPFESAAYSTPIGQLSPIIRTQFGYHLLKVNDKRETLGRIKIAHIMKRFPPRASAEDSTQTETKIKALYQQLTEGADWFVLATKESEDLSTKDRGGSLPWFGAGNLPASLETVAFELQKKGEISKPVKSPYGWHILKLEEKRGVGSLQSMQESLSARVQRDQRSELKDAQVIQKLKKENDFKKYEAAYQLITEKNVLTPDNFRKKELESTLFSIANNTYTIENFLQTHDDAADVQTSLESYERSELIAFEEKNLETKYPEYKFLRREYKEGLLLFEIMNQKVWNRIDSDTSELKSFYQNNRRNYQTNPQIELARILFSDTSKIKLFKKPINTRYFPLGEPLMYDNTKSLREQIENYVDVEENIYISATVPSNFSEEDSLSLVKKINESFTNKHVLNLTYSNENKIYLQLLSDANDVLAKYTSEIESAETQIIELTKNSRWNNEKEQKPAISMTANGMIEVSYLIQRFPPRQMTFEEAKPQLLQDYQQHLEKEWLHDLKQKYDVNINKSVVKKIKTEIEK